MSNVDDLIEAAHKRAGRRIDRQAFRLFLDALDCCYRSGGEGDPHPSDVAARMWQMCHREHGALAALVWRRWGLSGGWAATAAVALNLSGVGLIDVSEHRADDFCVPVDIDKSTATVARNRLRQIRRGA